MAMTTGYSWRVKAEASLIVIVDEAEIDRGEAAKVHRRKYADETIFGEIVIISNAVLAFQNTSFYST